MPKPRNVFGREELTKDVTIDCDAVVVGSGAGGGVVAAELAEAGLDVVVLEEGGYHPTEEFTGVASDMVPKLYRDHGASIAVGSPVIIYGEGRCVGGSTVVNGGIGYISAAVGVNTQSTPASSHNRRSFARSRG